MGKRDSKKSGPMDIFATSASGSGRRGSLPGAEGRVVQAAQVAIDAAMIQSMFLELKAGISSLNTKMDEQAASVTGMQVAIDGLKLRDIDLDERVVKLETEVSSLSSRLQETDARLKTCVNKNEDLESRSRRNNLRLVGLDESWAPRDMAAQMEGMLKELLGQDIFSPMFSVERAHRSLAPRPPPGAPPRPIILRLLNFRDRDAALRAARERGELRFQGTRVSLYPDFSSSVQAARKGFDDVKETLRHHEIRYAMLFPARLRVIWQERVHFFSSPEQATEFINLNIGPLRRRPTRGPGRGARNNVRRRPGRGGRGARVEAEPLAEAETSLQTEMDS